MATKKDKKKSPVEEEKIEPVKVKPAPLPNVTLLTTDSKIAALTARVLDLEKFAMASVPHDETTMIAQRALRKRIGDFK